MSLLVNNILLVSTSFKPIHEDVGSCINMSDKFCILSVKSQTTRERTNLPWRLGGLMWCFGCWRSLKSPIHDRHMDVSVSQFDLFLLSLTWIKNTKHVVLCAKAFTAFCLGCRFGRLYTYCFLTFCNADMGHHTHFLLVHVLKQKFESRSNTSTNIEKHRK